MDDFYYELEGMRKLRRMTMSQIREWSDGGVTGMCSSYLEPAVKLSRVTGKYIPVGMCEDESGAEDEGNVCNPELGVLEFADAYAQMEEDGTLDSSTRFLLLKNIIHSFNDRYRREYDSPEPSLKELNCFINAAMAMQRYDNEMVPISLKAELFREIGLFGQVQYMCKKFEGAPGLEEVLSHALNGKTRPFVTRRYNPGLMDCDK